MSSIGILQVNSQISDLPLTDKEMAELYSVPLKKAARPIVTVVQAPSVVSDDSDSSGNLPRLLWSIYGSIYVLQTFFKNSFRMFIIEMQVMRKHLRYLPYMEIQEYFLVLQVLFRGILP